MLMYNPKAMISQPMRGLSKDEILKVRERAIKYLKYHGYLVLNTFFDDEQHSFDYLIKQDIRRPDVYNLSEAIKILSKCNVIYFCKGWENAVGCKHEHAIAQSYGIKCLYESEISDSEISDIE